MLILYYLDNLRTEWISTTYVVAYTYLSVLLTLMSEWSFCLGNCIYLVLGKLNMNKVILCIQLPTQLYDTCFKKVGNKNTNF